jgi:type IV pilus assembly protein PilV
MSMMPYSYRRAHSAGFSLLEALISVVVLSTGVLSMGHLMLTAQKSSDDAAQRAVAAVLGNAILDGMRANMSDASLGSASAYNAQLTSSSSSGDSSNCVGTSSCSAAELAQAQLADWTQQLGALPHGQGSIAVATSTDASGTSYSVATVTIFWNAQRAGVATTDKAGADQLQTAGCNEGVSVSATGECYLHVTLESVL